MVREGGTKRLWSKVSIPSLKMISLPKKQRTVDRQFSFAHAVKMAIMQEAFPSFRLSSDDFDHVQMEMLRRMDMIPLGGYMPKILRSSLQAGAIIIFCEDDETS